MGSDCINSLLLLIVLLLSGLKFYFMGICKDINSNFCHLYIFQSRQKRKEYSGLTFY